MVAIFLWTIAVLLLLQLLFVSWNVRQLALLGSSAGGKNEPDNWSSEEAVLLSVLIPARNEEGNIPACIQSVLAELGPNMEVIVLDDESQDYTYAAALAAGKGDERFRLLEGSPKPEGWLGKSYACHQLAHAAKGKWLLFLDADARLKPGALKAAMAAARSQKWGLITGFPFQETGSWAEQLILPLMTFTIACHLPIPLIRHSIDPKFAAAHGAFMLIEAESYHSIGGHASIKDQLVDDMELAKAVKRRGLPMTLADITPYVTMRMYQDSRSVWNGFKKNLFAGVGRNSLLLGFLMLLYAALYLLPPLCLAAATTISILFGGMGHELVWPVLTGWLLGIIIKLVVDRSSGQPLKLAFLLPAGIVMLIGIAFDSWRASATGEGYEWKGRRYL